MLIAFMSVSAYAQCPPEGTDKDGNPLGAKEQQLNRNKNKSARITNNYADYWDIQSVLKAPRHNDRDEFEVGEYVYLEGYLISSTPEKGETCNCYEADHDKARGDVHIYISTSKNATDDKSVIVEITPDYKLRNPDFEEQLAGLNNKKVRVWGYLLYDYIHEKNSVNMCTSCSARAVWRKTCWEIHPIVSIEQLPDNYKLYAFQ